MAIKFYFVNLKKDLLPVGYHQIFLLGQVGRQE